VPTKIIPFDLEKAKAGAEVVTRDGYPVEILTFGRNHKEYPLVGLINYPEESALETWTEWGEYDIVEDWEEAVDLLLQVETTYLYVNVYESCKGHKYIDGSASSLEEAKKKIRKTAKYLETIEVEV